MKEVIGPASADVARRRRAATLVVLLLVGCSNRENVYEVALKPQGDKIERQLTFSHGKQGISLSERPEIERLAKVFGVSAPDLPAKKVSFLGTFAGRLPQDVGGAGHFVRWDSPLGGVAVYVERFRGNDDIHTALEARRKAVDQVIDFLVGWFETELRDIASWPALRGFLDTTFRADLQNLSLYLCAFNLRPVADSKELTAEIGFRVVQYFVERGYTSYEEAPALDRALEDANRRNDATALLTKARSLLIARAQGAKDDVLAKRLAFLSDPKQCYASWQRYFQTTEYFKQHKLEILRKRERARKEQLEQLAKPIGSGPTGTRHHAADAKPEESQIESEIFGDLLATSFASFIGTPFGGIFGGDVNRLEASLAAPREPFWTNGKWHAEKQRVAWSEEIGPGTRTDGPRGLDWPTLCIAAWDEPNEAAQKQIFGQVSLTHTKLLEYCLWYHGLSSTEKREWDALLPTLKKDELSVQRLEAFRFSDEPAGRKSHNCIAAPAAETLLELLRAPKP